SGVLAFLIAMWIADFLFHTPQSELMQNSRAKEKSLVGWGVLGPHSFRFLHSLKSLDFYFGVFAVS
ncbi:MAG: hypothetical protein WB505_14275, partial [Pseudolabrys sp.]